MRSDQSSIGFHPAFTDKNKFGKRTWTRIPLPLTWTNLAVKVYCRKHCHTSFWPAKRKSQWKLSASFPPQPPPPTAPTPSSLWQTENTLKQEPKPRPHFWQRPQHELSLFPMFYTRTLHLFSLYGLKDGRYDVMQAGRTVTFPAPFSPSSARPLNQLTFLLII